MKTLLASAHSDQYFDAWELLDAAPREQEVRRRLDAYVRFAGANAPFYRERTAAYDPQAAHPLARMPVLQASDVRQLVPPAGRDLLTEDGLACTVFQSGGTTGFPKTTLFTHAELEGLNLPNARGFYALGLRSTDRVANLWAVGGLYMTFVHINRMLQQYGCTSFPFSNHTPNDFVATVAKLFQINCFSGIASVALSCLRYIAESGAAKGLQVDKIYYGGEHLYEADKADLRAKFGTKVIAAPGYGTVDSWYIGYQCLACDTGVFHTHDDQCYVEIVDEDKDAHCAPGDVGMLYATAFPRRLTPIIRYRVGDRARWLGGDCPCGRRTPRFQLLGRGDDVLRIGFDSIDYDCLQEIALRSGLVLGTVQMEKQRDGGRDRLVVRMETEADPAAYGGIATQIERMLIEARPTLAKGVAGGTTHPVLIILSAPGTIPRNPRTGKLVRVIDAIKD